MDGSRGSITLVRSASTPHVIHPLPPDSLNRRRGLRAGQTREAEGVLDRPQEAVVIRRPGEDGAGTNRAADGERDDAASPALARRPLVEDDEDDGLRKREQGRDEVL